MERVCWIIIALGPGGLYGLWGLWPLGLYGLWGLWPLGLYGLWGLWPLVLYFFDFLGKESNTHVFHFSGIPEFQN
jgi:hypothetical protein